MKKGRSVAQNTLPRKLQTASARDLGNNSKLMPWIQWINCASHLKTEWRTPETRSSKSLHSVFVPKLRRVFWILIWFPCRWHATETTPSQILWQLNSKTKIRSLLLGQMGRNTRARFICFLDVANLSSQLSQIKNKDFCGVKFTEFLSLAFRLSTQKCLNNDTHTWEITKCYKKLKFHCDINSENADQ